MHSNVGEAFWSCFPTPIRRVSNYQVLTFKLLSSNDRFSSSHDDTILIWDFLNAEKDGENGDTNEVNIKFLSALEKSIF